jgi:acetoin utilization deacetylase AcuC-like enzyme
MMTLTTGRIHVLRDPRYREHAAPRGHPECPERLASVEEAVAEFEARTEAVTPRMAEPHEILRIHEADLLRQVEEASRRAPAQLDPDTYVSSRSFETALLAAGGTIELARRVAGGEAACGLAIVRPPGHHAEATHAMGFCLFNNVAIAARALQAEDGLEKLLIFDWDVHHGNGTQHSFEDDPSVLYVSTHQFPYYPGTGAATEAGAGPGLGCTLNIPMPAGCGDAEYVGVLQRVLIPAARQFRPEMILVSCGFDAHGDDPLASMELTGDGFLTMTRLVRALADELCGGRTLFVLEGGYAASSLREGTRSVLQGLLESPPGSLPDLSEVAPGSRLRAILDRVIAVQRHHFRDLGAG